jgi:hypothetical protein
VFVLLYSEFIELATINRYKTVSIRISRIEPDPFIFGTDAHSFKIQGMGSWGFCQNLGGGYIGVAKFGDRAHLFGVLLHFYKQVLPKFWCEGTLLFPLSPGCINGKNSVN